MTRPRRRRGSPSVRTKVLASVLAMSALGLAVAWVVTDTIQTRAVVERVDAELVQEVEEFRVLAERGIDPGTGEPFAGVDELLRVTIERNVPGAHEMMVTFVDGVARQYSPSWSRPLVDDPGLAAVVDSVGPDATHVVRTQLDTDLGAVRVAAVPVRVGGDEQAGVLAIAIGLDLALQSQRDLRTTFVLVSVGVLVLVGVVGWIVTGRLLRPLSLLAETARNVGGDDLTRRAPVTGEDDVATLGRSFNTMLDRLADSFEAQRQFLDDTGHELRTPLTVLRGHLELMDPSDVEDVVETRALLLDEAERMSRLVEDLVLLAKSERPDFVALAPVDLGRLTDDLLDKARALGDRTWRIDARAEAVVDGDAQRLTQAVLQLADNAVKFTEPGTTVAVGSAVVDGVATLWLRDDGPGVPAEDRERVFARFARTDSAAPVAGSGLGLAIVAAIAHGHGGTVRAASGAGTGQNPGFQVTLAWPQHAATAAVGVGPDRQGGTR